MMQMKQTNQANRKNRNSSFPHASFAHCSPKANRGVQSERAASPYKKDRHSSSPHEKSRAKIPLASSHRWKIQFWPTTRRPVKALQQLLDWEISPAPIIRVLWSAEILVTWTHTLFQGSNPCQTRVGTPRVMTKVLDRQLPPASVSQHMFTFVELVRLCSRKAPLFKGWISTGFTRLFTWSVLFWKSPMSLYSKTSSIFLKIRC